MMGPVKVTIRQDVSRSGDDYGHVVTFTRYTEYGERVSALAVSQLSEADLKALEFAVTSYLNGNDVS